MQQCYVLMSLGVFDIVLRIIVLCGATHLHDVARVFERVGVPPEVFQEFLELAQHSALELGECPSHLTDMLLESYSATWFTVQGTPGVVATEAGTKPGDPLGDMLSFFLFLICVCPECSQL